LRDGTRQESPEHDFGAALGSHELSGTGRSRDTRPARSRTAQFQLRPAAALLTAAVLAVFVAGMVIGGLAGGIIVGLLAVGAGALLAFRWHAIDRRIRMYRLGVVLISLIVAVTLMTRNH